MKKSLLALAVLGAFAGVASAQSSVTLFGTLDLNGRYVKNDGSNARYSLSQDGINSSQLGFKGSEDLGGGLKAGFVLIAGVNADTGSTNSQFFNRSAYGQLMGGFGEVRLGRDYTPTFWNNTIFDAFGTNGLGGSNNVKQSFAPDYVRANNAISYFLPGGIGGVYGQVMVAAGEGAAPGRYTGGRVGFAAGPFDIAGAYSEERIAAGTYKTANIGGAYDFGVVKLMGYWNQEKILSAKDNVYSVTAVVPMGQGEIHAGYNYGKLTNTGVSNKVDQIALGYVYNLSKRTALYTNVSRLSNGSMSASSLGSVGISTVGVGGSGSATAAPTFGGKSQGAEFGLRHFF